MHRYTDKLTDRQTNRQIDKQTNRQTDRQTDRQTETGRHARKQPGRKTNKQPITQPAKHTNTLTNTPDNHTDKSHAERAKCTRLAPALRNNAQCSHSAHQPRARTRRCATQYANAPHAIPNPPARTNFQRGAHPKCAPQFATARTTCPDRVPKTVTRFGSTFYGRPMMRANCLNAHINDAHACRVHARSGPYAQTYARLHTQCSHSAHQLRANNGDATHTLHTRCAPSRNHRREQTPSAAQSPKHASPRATTRDTR